MAAITHSSQHPARTSVPWSVLSQSSTPISAHIIHHLEHSQHLRRSESDFSDSESDLCYSHEAFVWWLDSLHICISSVTIIGKVHFTSLMALQWSHITRRTYDVLCREWCHRTRGKKPWSTKMSTQDRKRIKSHHQRNVSHYVPDSENWLQPAKSHIKLVNNIPGLRPDVSHQLHQQDAVAKTLWSMKSLFKWMILGGPPDVASARLYKRFLLWHWSIAWGKFHVSSLPLYLVVDSGYLKSRSSFRSLRSFIQE